MNLLGDEMSCPYCSVGRLRRRTATYVRLFADTLITLPGMPASECDVCHRREFDADIVQRVESLIIPSGPPPNRYQPTVPTPPASAPATTTTAVPAKRPAQPKSRSAGTGSAAADARTPKQKIRPKG